MVRPPVCGAFLRRRNVSFDSSCAWCGHQSREHEYVDTTAWSTTGPFVPAGLTETRVLNPLYRPEVAA